MKDESKTKGQLISELNELRQQIVAAKEFEEVLRDRCERFETAFLKNLTPMAITTVEEGRYVDVNEAFEIIIGIKREKIIGNTPIDIGYITADQRAAFLSELNTKGYAENFEVETRTTGNEIRYVLFNTSKIKLNRKDYLLTVVTDITERKQMETELARARDFVENMEDACCEMDLAGNLTFYNEAFLKTTGYTYDEYMALSHWDRHPTREEAKHAFKIYDDVYRTGIPAKNVEYKSLHKDGTISIAEGSISLIHDKSGNPVGLRAIGRDITERRQMEETLRRSEERYRTILDEMADGYFEVDLTGNYTFVNDANCHLLGYPREELIGINFRSQVVKEDIKILYNTFNNIYRTGKPERGISYRALCKDGTTGFAEISAFPMLNKKGAVIGFRGIGRDVTERKRMELELARYRDFVENVEDACFEMDLSGNVTFYNEPFLKTTGHTYDEYLAMSRWDRHPTREEAKRVFKIYDNVHRTGIPAKSVEFKRSRKDGTINVSEVSISLVLDKLGQPVGFRGIGRDITDRKQAEEEKARLQDQLLQAQKMESVGRLAGGVAHDFNNMLGVIIGHTDMAMDHVDQDQPLFAHLMEIRKAAERSAKLTRQLLAFARKQTVSPKVLDINETVDGMLKMLQRIMGEDIHLAWLPGVNLWHVKMDPSQIDQILANLCVNARDAIDGVGKVTIETGNITFNEAYCIDHMGSVPGEYALLAVSDDGCGMSKDILGKIFEPFFTTKEVGKGTGLGLATVYGIVKQNNGFINVYSEPDQGTTFKIYLPRHIGKAEQADMEKHQEPVIGGQETVLVVEDEAAILDLCKLMLENHGYRVLTAGAPGEAIRMAEEHLGKIHLLMTDVIMPEMNGRDLAKKILSLYPDIKRLFMSGYTADVIAHHGVLDEGVYFIQKPFSAIDLVAKVRAALDQK